jgi:hypothetical protein
VRPAGRLRGENEPEGSKLWGGGSMQMAGFRLKIQAIYLCERENFTKLRIFRGCQYFVCQEHIVFLPPIYNYSSGLNKYLKRKKGNSIYSENEIHKISTNPAIIHWAGDYKPWLFYGIYFADYWFNIFKISPFKEMQLKRKYALLNKIKNRFLRWLTNR